MRDVQQGAGRVERFGERDEVCLHVVGGAHDKEARILWGAGVNVPDGAERDSATIIECGFDSPVSAAGGSAAGLLLGGQEEGALDDLDDALEESGAVGTVDDSVVVGKGEREDFSEFDSALPIYGLV